MTINTNKTKELIICYSKKVNVNDIPLLCINGHSIERVNELKLLGDLITAELLWDNHVAYMLRKVDKRKYCSIYFVHAIACLPSDILCVYCSIIRSVLEYACPV